MAAIAMTLTDLEDHFCYCKHT